MKTVNKVILSTLLILFSLISSPLGISEEEKVLRIMTFNIWVGGAAGEQPLEQTT